MSQADSDNSTAAPRGRSFTPDTARLAKEEAKRWRAIKRLRKLRAKAADEIDRLLEFLDAVDDTDVDSQCDDDPIDADDDAEPALGSINPTIGGTQAGWAFGSDDDTEQEHDGAEPDVDDEPSLGSTNDYHGSGPSYENCRGLVDGEGPEDDLEPNLGSGDGSDREEDRADEEASLGWTDEEAARGRTYAGSYGTSADCEEGEPARPPQNRTSIDREPIIVEVSYRRFLRGLTPEQRNRVKAARQKGVGSDVIIA
jgi:hypothetical protein